MHFVVIKLLTFFQFNGIMIFQFKTRKMLKKSRKLNQQPSVNVTSVKKRHRKSTIYNLLIFSILFRT